MASSATRQRIRVRVTIQEIDGQPAPQALRDVLRAEAGADGRFRVEMLPAGGHVLSVTAPGYASKRVEVNVPSSGRDVDLGDVELETGLATSARRRLEASFHPIANRALDELLLRWLDLVAEEPRCPGGLRRAI